MGHHHEDGQEHTELSFREKGDKLLKHWIQHNQEHLHNYQRWENEFRAHHFHEIAELLASAAQLTGRINETLTKAFELLDS